MIHNFSGIIYLSIKSLTLEPALKDPTICIPKTQNQQFEEVLANRMQNNDNDEQEQMFMGELYEEIGINNFGWPTMEQCNKIELLKVHALPCQADSEFRILVEQQDKDKERKFVGLGTFPLRQIVGIPLVRHQLDIDVIDYLQYMKIQELMKIKQQTAERMNWNQIQSYEETQNKKFNKPIFSEIKQQFGQQIDDNEITKYVQQEVKVLGAGRIQHHKIGTIRLNMIYLNHRIGRLIFQKVEIDPSMQSQIADIVEPELLIRIDETQIRNATFKAPQKSKILWHKCLEFQVERIPTKISITLLNRFDKEEVAFVNVPLFKAQMLLPSAKARKLVLKMYRQKGKQYILMGEIMIKHRFEVNYR